MLTGTSPTRMDTGVSWTELGTWLSSHWLVSWENSVLVFSITLGHHGTVALPDIPSPQGHPLWPLTGDFCYLSLGIHWGGSCECGQMPSVPMAGPPGLPKAGAGQGNQWSWGPCPHRLPKTGGFPHLIFGGASPCLQGMSSLNL